MPKPTTLKVAFSAGKAVFRAKKNKPIGGGIHHANPQLARKSYPTSPNWHADLRSEMPCPWLHRTKATPNALTDLRPRTVTLARGEVK